MSRLRFQSVMEATGRRRSVIGVLMVLAGLVGCGATGPPMAPVRGVVTFDGKPLQSGNVVFIPEIGGKFASGEISSDGAYCLTTFEEGDGALVGNHRIMVSAVHFPGGNESPAVPLIPFRYGSDQTSGLTAMVVDQPDNVVDLALTSKSPAKRR
jgi:hypothetical protein